MHLMAIVRRVDRPRGSIGQEEIGTGGIIGAFRFTLMMRDKLSTRTDPGRRAPYRTKCNCIF